MNINNNYFIYSLFNWQSSGAIQTQIYYFVTVGEVSSRKGQHCLNLLSFFFFLIKQQETLLATLLMPKTSITKVVPPCGEGLTQSPFFSAAFFEIPKEKLFSCSVRGSFIWEIHRCNGVSECPDGSDEMGCQDGKSDSPSCLSFYVRGSQSGSLRHLLSGSFGVVSLCRSQTLRK